MVSAVLVVCLENKAPSFFCRADSRLKLASLMSPEKREYNGTVEPSQTRVFFRRRQLPNSRCELDTDGYRNGDACSLLPAVC